MPNTTAPLNKLPALTSTPMGLNRLKDLYWNAVSQLSDDEHFHTAVTLAPPRKTLDPTQGPKILDCNVTYEHRTFAPSSSNSPALWFSYHPFVQRQNLTQPNRHHDLISLLWGFGSVQTPPTEPAPIDFLAPLFKALAWTQHCDEPSHYCPVHVQLLGCSLNPATLHWLSSVDPVNIERPLLFLRDANATRVPLASSQEHRVALQGAWDAIDASWAQAAFDLIQQQCRFDAPALFYAFQQPQVQQHAQLLSIAQQTSCLSLLLHVVARPLTETTLKLLQSPLLKEPAFQPFLHSLFEHAYHHIEQHGALLHFPAKPKATGYADLYGAVCNALNIDFKASTPSNPSLMANDCITPPTVHAALGHAHTVLQRGGLVPLTPPSESSASLAQLQQISHHIHNTLELHLKTTNPALAKPLLDHAQTFIETVSTPSFLPNTHTKAPSVFSPFYYLMTHLPSMLTRSSDLSVTAFSQQLALLSQKSLSDAPLTVFYFTPEGNPRLSSCALTQENALLSFERFLVFCLKDFFIPPVAFLVKPERIQCQIEFLTHLTQNPTLATALPAVFAHYRNRMAIPDHLRLFEEHQQFTQTLLKEPAPTDGAVRPQPKRL